jgi:phosphate transport system protein
VIAADDAVDALQKELDVRTLDLIARQQPVAGDLRTLVTSLRMSADLERMGDLARHVAKIARMRYPECAIPRSCARPSSGWARSASSSPGRSHRSSRARTSTAARSLETDDDAVDRLHRAVFTALPRPEEPYPIETAIDVTLISRYYERFADHAVSVANR